MKTSNFKFNIDGKKSWKIFIFCVIIFIAQDIFFRQSTLNYPLFIYLICVALSILLTVIMNWNQNSFSTKETNSVFLKMIFAFLVFIKNTFFFFFISGSVILTVFGVFDKIYASQNPIETYNLKIEQSYCGTGRSLPSFLFYFKEKSQSKYSTDIRRIMKDGKEHFIELKCREGWMGSYFIEELEIH